MILDRKIASYLMSEMAILRPPSQRATTAPVMNTHIKTSTLYNIFSYPTPSSEVEPHYVTLELEGHLMTRNIIYSVPRERKATP